MKYVKIAVPDDFDEDIVIRNSEHDETFPVWKPQYVNLLNHGFVGLVDFYGDDTAIVNAARVSYGTGTKKVREDRGLIRYLLRHLHCYRGDMQVLTVEGWKRWDEVSEYETYLIPDPKTRTLRCETLRLEEFYTEDTKLYTFENERMSYAVTENHRMWFKRKYQDNFNIVRVQNMSKWGHFDPMIGYRHVSKDVEPDRVHEFIGFYLGDGHYASTNRISFHLKKNRKREYLLNLLHDLDLSYSVTSSSTHDDAIIVYVETPTFLREGILLEARSADKEFYNRLIDMSGAEILGLWTGLLNSDGSHKGTRQSQHEFSSKSDAMVSLFETLSAYLGMDAHHRKLDGRVCAYDDTGRTSLESRKQYHSTETFTGKVFCVTSSTGLLMVRGGPDKFGFVSGNTTPFEMVDFKFHVKAPIFVFRQWHRHRTFSINEYSARYSVMTDEMYEPTHENLAPQSTTNRQGRDVHMLSESDYIAIMSTVDHIFQESYQAYQHLLGPNETTGEVPKPPQAIQDRIDWCRDAAVAAVQEARKRAIESEREDPYPTEESLEEAIQAYLDQNGVAHISTDFPGIARELARMVLPVATYSEMYWKGNLWNLMHFMKLRCDSHAQYEIRVYADALRELITPHVEWAMEAWTDYLHDAKRLSRMEVEAIRELMSKDGFGENSRRIGELLERKGASKREVTEFLATYF